MLDPTLKTQLEGYLQRLQGPVDLVAAFDERPASRELRALLDELVALSPRLALRELPSEVAVRRPSFGVAPRGQAPRVRFAGVPLGHEFTSLVLALLQVSGLPPKIDDAARRSVVALPAQRLETYVSLSCHSCPDVVQALNAMAVLHPGVEHEMIDGAVFPDEVEARKIMGVPAVFRDGALVHQGRASVEELLSVLDREAAARAARALDAEAPYDVLVLGGGPAGASAAIYAARKGVRTGLVAERFGGQVGDTVGIENLISVTYTEGPKLVAAMEQHVRAWPVDLHVGQRAAALLPAGPDGLHTIRLENGASLRSRTVILATGARWREMGVPGEAAYRTRGVTFCPHCDGPLFRGKRVAVIGGGNSGVEAALDLAGVVSHVTLLEFDGRLRADEVLQARLRALPNVEVIVQAQTTEVLGDGQQVQGLLYRDRPSGELRRVDLDGVFVQIGLVPRTDWLGDAVPRTPRGEVIVDDRGATAVPGVFAAGDATTSPYKQIVIALGDGAKAALSAFDHLVRSGANRG